MFIGLPLSHQPLLLREAVDLDGRIEPGDMLLQVNDVNIENMSNDDAVRVLREMFHKPGPMTLTVAKCWDPTPKQCLTFLPKLGTPVAQYGEQPNSQSITTVTSTNSSMTSSLPVSDGIPCCVIVGVSRKRSDTSVLYACKVENCLIAEGNPVCLVKPDCSCIWQNDEINEKRIVVGAILKYHIGDLYIYVANTGKKIDVDKIQMDLEYGVNAYKGIKDAITTKRMGCFLIAIAGGIIKNERITFWTKSGEYVNCPLNCRKHLTMSASPSVLQPRPLTEKDDVGDVAVIKCNSAMKNAQVVCEALILKYDPTVISIDEEPVEIKNADGVFVLCPGMVTFDTGNTAATSISNEVLNILKLKDKVDHTKPFRYTAAGRNGNKKNGGVCSRVWIELKIRGLLFPVFALVDVAVENVGLLIGMDVIDKLNQKNFTLGK